jgi:hypothetical protein
MKFSRSSYTLLVCFLLTGFPAVSAFGIYPQDQPKRETIQAQAMGQSTSAGKQFNVTISINSYSTPDDQKVLIDAFTQGGQRALTKALSKMKSKGRVGVSGTLGYDIAYIRTFPAEDGRKIRLITDRPIQLAEARESTRSKDYDLSALEVNPSNDSSKSFESLIIGLRVKVDKDNQLVFESYGSGPWKLVNIMERG